MQHVLCPSIDQLGLKKTDHISNRFFKWIFCEKQERTDVFKKMTVTCTLADALLRFLEFILRISHVDFHDRFSLHLRV
jgi:hypothetical protein